MLFFPTISTVAHGGEGCSLNQLCFFIVLHIASVLKDVTGCFVSAHIPGGEYGRVNNQVTTVGQILHCSYAVMHKIGDIFMNVANNYHLVS